MKIATIVGTRPNFIKCAPVSRVMRANHREVLIHTGQHYDYEMNKIFFDDLSIPTPDYHLEVGSGSHGWQTGEMLTKIEQVLVDVQPDFVLVYGDCNNAIAGALAAVKLHIRIGHVEAGLRSFDRRMPEEINRVLVDHCSDLLFCPTDTAVQNLKHEGITQHVFQVGDVMVDSLQHALHLAHTSTIVTELQLSPGSYLVATVHRAENTEDKQRLTRLIDAFNMIEEPIVFPLHPRTEKCLKRFDLSHRVGDHITMIKPLGYSDFLKLIADSRMILTDSGGLQKEAYILKKLCVTLRETTEWVETIEDGWNVLVGTDKDKIVDSVVQMRVPLVEKNRYGQGDASQQIVQAIETTLNT